MNETFDLEAHIARGVERIVSDALRATVRDPRESLFLAKFAAASRKATKTRQRLAEQGEHVPSFLIASITSACNLHCAGCYSRCTEATTDCAPVRQLTGEDWTAVFREAESLGVSFILLAGGEPMLRRDVIEAAGERQNLLFPIFNNWTFFGERDWQLLDRCRNLIPVLSLEGGRERTDARRGAGIYDRLLHNMEELQKRGLLFGASVTVTTENLAEVTSVEFLKTLTERGCKLVIYVEYVPMSADTLRLAPGEPERRAMTAALAELRALWPDLILLSFPGDERADGGCMAAGRGFIHINSHGGAEPCPFSPYSDINVKDTSLREALRSPLFRALREGDFLDDEHVGGCVLFEKREQVEALLSAGKAAQ
ncbi:MAG: radical SAM protein [Oscillospiraceae bacterium]|nr:radical SAM protein [Oscillospiraceae bacterium]